MTTMTEPARSQSYPLPSLHEWFEQDHVERRCECRFYDRCLSTAARHDWPGFSCGACPAFRSLPPERERAERRPLLELALLLIRGLDADDVLAPGFGGEAATTAFLADDDAMAYLVECLERTNEVAEVPSAAPHWRQEKELVVEREDVELPPVDAPSEERRAPKATGDGNVWTIYFDDPEADNDNEER